MNITEEKFDVVILAGQSNAEGNGRGDVTHQFKSNEKIYILQDKNRSGIKFDNNSSTLISEKDVDNEIILAKEQEDENHVKIGNFSLTFAEEYVKSGLLDDDRKLLIIYSAVGGTGFARHQWGNTALLQERMFKMVDYALSLNKENKVVAFLWHQGEHDAFENVDLSLKTRENFYYEKFGFLVKQVKEKYGNNIPVIAGGFCSEWVNSGYEKQCYAVNNATKRVLKDNGGLFIKTSDLKSNNQTIGNGDNIHFSKQSLYILGKRYFNAYKKIINR